MSDEDDKPSLKSRWFASRTPTPKADKPVARPAKPKPLPYFSPGEKRTSTFREALTTYAGENGVKMLAILSDIANGKAWTPIDENGREGPPQVPSTADRSHAALNLLWLVSGKPVPQTKLVEAELASRASRTLEDVDTKQLEEEYISRLEAQGRVKRIEATPLAMAEPVTVDAEVIPPDPDET